MHPGNDRFIRLTDRCVIDISGEDAFDFLQNIVTNDIRKADTNKLVYACLLMPQGFYLHDFFVGRTERGYFLDCEIAGVEELLRRLTMFRLRSKVDFHRSEQAVYAGQSGCPDPRLPALPHRIYGGSASGARPVATYHDLCIGLGVPCGTRAIEPGRDTMADVNLDLLNAVAWDKGCFVGQEVAARMYHRNIAKRRMVMITGEGLAAGDKLFAGDKEAGEIRQVSSDGGSVLAQVKSAYFTAPGLMTARGAPCAVHVPAYFPISIDKSTL